jgi:hypothetical protein
MIHNILQDIIRDPQEYRPVLVLLAVVLGIWLCLCVCAVASACRCIANRKLRLFLALGALLPGLLGVYAQLPVSAESNGVRWSADLRWLFLLPAWLGLRALVKWWKDGRSQTPVALTTAQDSGNRG